jgi:hypothetical protein
VERGSALLAAIVFTAVALILGFALFTLGVYESRAAATDLIDQQTLYIAEAGMERAMARLTLAVAEGRVNANLATPTRPRRCDTGEGLTADELCFNWAAAPLCQGGPCTAGEFRPASADVASGTFSDGSFAVSFMLIRRGEVGRPWSLIAADCRFATEDPLANCAEYIFVRSTGMAGPSTGGRRVGYQPERTVQALVCANRVQPPVQVMPPAPPAREFCGKPGDTRLLNPIDLGDPLYLVVRRAMTVSRSGELAGFWVECKGAELPPGSCSYQ